jgi:hypothetical protein
MAFSGVSSPWTGLERIASGENTRASRFFIPQSSELLPFNGNTVHA